MTLTIDGSVSTAAAACTLSTTNANDIIIAMPIGTSGPITVTGITDTALLSWTKLIRQAGATSIDAEIWWAYSSGVLTSNVITAAASGGSVARMTAFGVSGVNSAYYANPWDTNASAVESMANVGSSAASVTISTTSANTMLISLIRVLGATGTMTRPSGFNVVVSTGADQDVAYNVVSSPQSGVAENFSWTGASNENVLIVAAINGGAPAANTNSPFVAGWF